jgi:hypothetical protein
LALASRRYFILLAVAGFDGFEAVPRLALPSVADIMDLVTAFPTRISILR